LDAPKRPFFFWGRLGKEITFPLSISGHPVPKNSPNFSAATRSFCVKVCVQFSVTLLPLCQRGCLRICCGIARGVILLPRPSDANTPWQKQSALCVCEFGPRRARLPLDTTRVRGPLDRMRSD